VKDQLVLKVAAMAEKTAVGPAWADGAAMGPLITVTNASVAGFVTPGPRRGHGAGHQ
jgi:hypothetical protein